MIDFIHTTGLLVSLRKSPAVIHGMELLRKAEDVLCEEDGPLRDRLLMAGRWFSSALSYRDFWPEPLRQQADRIAVRLCGGAPTRLTLGTLDDDTVPVLASQIVELVEEAEKASDDPALLLRN